MFKRLIVGIVAIIMAAPTAFADDPDVLDTLVGTAFTRTLPQFASGKLDGCMIEYGAFAEDWIYAQGNLIGIGGGIGVLVKNGTFASILKVVVNDLAFAQGKVTRTPNAPTRAYLVSSDHLTTTIEAVVGSYASDIPGGIFVVSGITPSLDILLEAIVTKTITISFNKGTGDRDIILELDLSVIETNQDGSRVIGEKTIKEFLACMEKILDETPSP